MFRLQRIAFYPQCLVAIKLQRDLAAPRETPQRIELIDATKYSRHSLIALTIVTTRLLIARNGASHLMSGSGSTSTKALVMGKNCCLGCSKNQTDANGMRLHQTGG